MDFSATTNICQYNKKAENVLLTKMAKISIETEEKDKTSQACPSICQTCLQSVDSVSSRLQCENCQELVHIACLQNKALPTNLLGDTFFILVCKKCSTIPKTEVVKRDKVNWLSGNKINANFISGIFYFHLKILVKKLLINFYFFSFGTSPI